MRLLGRKPILSRREQEFRAREQELLERLRGTLERLGERSSDAGSSARLAEAVELLEGLFLLVVAGEFNSGKSTFINALLGEELLPQGVTPTTDRINLIHHGPEVSEKADGAHVLERTYPAEVLRELTIVDTPGTNAVIREHEALTQDFVPRADLVLFVTSADRPFTESERAFLETIRTWGKKVVVIVNKVDILAADERREVVDFVRDNVSRLLGTEPEVFPVSARSALAARGEDDEGAWDASGMARVEAWLAETLDETERVRLKLLNPLNLALRVAETTQQAVFDRLKLLAEDVEAIENIDAQLATFHQRMLEDFRPRLDRLDRVLDGMRSRAEAFFDETIRIGRIRTLLDSDRVRSAFEKEVIGDAPARVEEEVQEIIDWIVERNLDVWQDVQKYIDRRRLERHQEDLIGEIGGFDYNRQALLASVGRVSRDLIGSYDREAEARAIANEVQGTFATTALAEVGAVGLGTLVATVITGAAADITGLVLATVLAVGGFYLIPRKRRQAKKAFRERVDALRDQLRAALESQVHREIDGATERVNRSIEPYRRFVETQRALLNDVRGDLVAVADALKRLRDEIQAA